MSPIDVAAVSVVPARTSCLNEATRLLRQDAAVIVCGHPHGARDVEPLLRSVLGDDVVNIGEPVEVRAAGGRDRPDLDADGHTQRSPLHTDGFALADGAPVGMEALARWRRPGRGLLPSRLGRGIAGLWFSGHQPWPVVVRL